MITIFLDGRLGNQMFQYSIIKILSEKLKYKFFINRNKISLTTENNPHYWIGDKLFNVDLGSTNYHFLKYFFYERNGYTKNVFNIKDDTILNGAFQSEKYLENYEDIIKESFKIIYNSEVVDKILKEYPIEEYCYIHFRGTDYKDISGWFLPVEYYNYAKSLMEDKYNIKKFIFITDDVNLCKTYFPNDIVLSNKMEDDFTILNKSKYLIISNSSFSWWAAWLNENNIVFAPKGWFNYKDYKKLGLFPEGINSKKFNWIHHEYR